MQNAIDLLKSHKLRKTPGRIDILEEFMENNFALSHRDIENSLGNKYDRVTLYRIMSGFEECGLIHRVFDGESAIKYALCSTDCDSGHHHDEHIHFLCDKCGKTYCLNFELPEIVLPKSYQLQELNVLAKGICENCKK
ncbi:transcriptional repressor [bacterium]|nr:transcriptional repressor [bacterium]